MSWLRALLLVLFVAGVAGAEDWPQWLGPRRDGSSTEKVKPWKGELTILWRQLVGPGHSSPVVAGGKVYLLTRGPDKGQETEELTVYDALTGKEGWRTGYPRVKFSSLFGTGPQATPAVVEGQVYTFGATGVLTCFDGKGSIRWQNDTQKTFELNDKEKLDFGVACSPLIEGDKVVVNVGARGASVVAFNKETGKVAWKKLDDRASYASGIAIGQGNKREILFLTQAGLRAFAPEDGTLRWQVSFVDGILNETSTTPVRAGDLVLISSITQGMVALDLTARDDKGTPKVAWRNKELSCYFSTPVPVGKEHVYMVTGSIFPPTSTLRCVELKTGKILWSEKNVGKYHAAMIRTADDKLLMLSDLGNLVLLDPSPAGYRELARSRIVKGEQIWAHPALSNGKVYLRSDKELICVQMPE
jgi:outer membrane protein assembly factor BamB